MTRKPYFYYQNTHYLVPFMQPGCAVRQPTEEEKEYLKNDTGPNGSNGVHLLIEDNGETGDGLLLSINTEISPQDAPPLFWGRLSIRGARAIHEALGHVLRMRDI